MPARGSLASRNQSIGIKVLDIKDQPLSFKDARKRKKDEEEKEKKVSLAFNERLISEIMSYHIVGPWMRVDFDVLSSLCRRIGMRRRRS